MTQSCLQPLKLMNLTSAQQAAIAARGNVIVVAGAGTGKTRTLVERCLSCLLTEKPPASLDEILMVTFTDAAAAEMRQRIRDRLEEEWERALKSKKPDAIHWAEQLALFETAHIGTLHSFCLQLVRRHFYGLKLDPQLTVLAEEEARLLADETLEAVLQRHYAGGNALAEAVQQLIQIQGRGWDEPIRALVLRLHHYTQTLPDPARWFRDQLALFGSPTPTQWERWLIEGVRDWRDRWLRALPKESSQNQKIAECVALLKRLPDKTSRAEATAILEQIRQAEQGWPRGKKTDWLKPLEHFFSDAAFLHSLVQVTAKSDPLAEDWVWVRSQMTALLELAAEFQKEFGEAKRERGVVDFHDLEQYALELLWDRTNDQPTAIAQQWRKKLRFVFVDEYQDINAAQDKIIETLSREGAQANRFLVGDVKQSIYRFRLADPSIFRKYAESWRDGNGKAIPLVENFRSRESILNFINSVFALLMRREIGGVLYDDGAQLRFGAAAERNLLSVEADASPRAELHLRVRGQGEASNAEGGEEENSQATAQVMELAEAEKEARMVALRLRELKSQPHQIWDNDAKSLRPMKWSDVAVLLRSPANKAESYAKEFERTGVPLVVARGGFYQSLEVMDLLSLLQVLDNPLQDVPALAVLHSPLVGLTLDDLASVRLALPKGHFWVALRRWYGVQSPESKSVVSSQWSAAKESDPKLRTTETFGKVEAFLKRFAQWRRLARQASLSRCLEAVLAETHYAEWLLTQARGEQRHANVQRLLSLARQFDKFQRQGLFRFLRFIEAQQLADTDPELAAVTEEDAVSLMSVHQSKGLEFPVVVVADLGKPFNLLDLHAGIILDERYGLCPQIQPPHTGQRYPSLPYWLARQRQKQELLGEELRLLYVAMTRARDTLILTGSVSENRFAQWKNIGEVNAAGLLRARGYLDWLGAWFAQNASKGEGEMEGENSLLRWTIYNDADGRLITGDRQAAPTPASADTISLIDAGARQQLLQRLAWQYPYRAATHAPAKTSVSALRRLADEADLAEQFQGSSFKFQVPREREAAKGKISAVEMGTAHHTFLQLVSLERVGSAEELRQEAERMQRQQALSAEENALLDFAALAAFWQSELGQKIRRQAKHVRRELAFTARFSPNELARLLQMQPDKMLEDEFVVVQGVADLAVLLPDEIWLLDFKTDQLGPEELPEKVKVYEPQLKLYAQALHKIYRRPVKEKWLHFFTLQRSASVGE